MQTNFCTRAAPGEVEHMGADSWCGKDSVQKSQIVPLNRHFHFWMFHVCLGVLCRRNLFQRKKRSVSMKKKRTRKSLSKTKARPLKFLAAKKSPAKKFAAKKKRQMPGYQATAPARPRGNFRVNVHVQKRPNPIKIFLPWTLKGKSLMADLELPNLLWVEVAQSVASLRGARANNLGLSLCVNPRFILLSFFQHDSAKQCRRRLQYRQWLRNCRNSVPLCHEWTLRGNFHPYSYLLLKTSVGCFGKCEQGRFYPRKHLVWNVKDTTIQVNGCVFWLAKSLVWTGGVLFPDVWKLQPTCSTAYTLLHV